MAILTLALTATLGDGVTTYIAVHSVQFQEGNPGAVAAMAAVGINNYIIVGNILTFILSVLILFQPKPLFPIGPKACTRTRNDLNGRFGQVSEARYQRARTSQTVFFLLWYGVAIALTGKLCSAAWNTVLLIVHG